MLKIIKKSRYQELLKKENTLDCRITNSETSTFEDLQELRRIIVAELTDLDKRIDYIQRIHKHMQKLN